MAKAAPVTGTPIAGWMFASSSNAGKYEFTLYRDGSMWCECAAWRFTKKNEPRTCPHYRALQPYLGDVLSGRRTAESVDHIVGALWRPDTPAAPSPAPAPAPVRQASGTRAIDLDD